MPKIDINLQRSKIFIFLILITILCSEIIISTLAFSFLLKSFFAILACSYGLFILYFHGLLSHNNSIVKLVIKKDRWMLRDNQNNTFHAELCGSSTLTRFVCIMRFKIKGEKFKRSCIIFKDTISSNQFRQLMVYSRVGKRA